MVPFIDLSRRGARFADAFAAVARRIALSGVYLLGAELAAFESELAEATGVEHAAGVASGASALQLALTAADVGPGDEVIVPAFTAVPTASAVVAAGARPVVADVDPATACVTSDSIDAVRTSRTKAAIVVHLYGYVADVPDGRDLVVVEDAAQAIGSFTAHTAPRSSAAVAYSFYPTKNLGGIGDGGAVVTSDVVLAERVRRLRAHGMTAQYVHESVSQNFRLSELDAAWLRLGLPTLADDVAVRQRIAAHYRAAAPQLRWQATVPDHSYHLCVFRSADRTRDRELLGRAGVATAVHYPLALTRQPAYAALFARSRCPAAEAWAAECISVPCFPEMSVAEVDQVAEALAGLPSYDVPLHGAPLSGTT